MFGGNATLLDILVSRHTMCEGWRDGSEGAFFHLASVLLCLAYMGGSGVFGSIYIYSLMAVGFFCYALWGWLDACGVDIFAWNLLLVAACLLQLAHVTYRLRRDTLEEELDNLYKACYVPLEVPISVYKEIVKCCDGQVVTLSKDQNYAVEGKTPIDRLSLLLSGRIRVTLDGQLLHYIYSYQFLDSPEWESLRPTEEGKFQVTLTAETDCRYITWRRRKLYLLLAKERYIARLFSVMLGHDIAEKLYSLNDKLFSKCGFRFDIRLPSLYHVLGPSSSSGDSENEREKATAAAAAPLAGAHPQHSAPSAHKPAPLSPTSPTPTAPTPPSKAPWPESEATVVQPLSRSYPKVLFKARAPLAPTQTPEL
ncbi:popeye domain-containing 2 [Latimeria chalumnae]|uniref:Popeye domain cAMP effector 2 n=1 Tax=Latimeria chalumnae TaxID=7897 RepID=H3B3W5_LATCH|nr:PREDICTED: popeye domain-containing protein 2 [Latimeria chalumnae]|eukprot:XP_006000120.1 PREDICTED: popeye domain-containing protein 2 [Latimeria chalumnae]